MLQLEKNLLLLVVYVSACLAQFSEEEIHTK